MLYLFVPGLDNSTELLIKKGADVNIVLEFGQTALMYAIEKGKKVL